MGHFSATVSSKLLDGWKQFALYNDGELSDAGFHADQITGADVEPILKAFWFDLNAIDDDETMRLAKDHFRAKKEQAKRASGPLIE